MWSSRLSNISSWFSRSASGRRRPSQQSTTEPLEVRSLLTGFVWSDATSLTISFAADGTNVAGNKNELYADLNHLGTPEQWQATIVSGFQTWLNELGYSITVVKDSGANFGIAGASHNDRRFGDVRVAAIPLTAGVLATAISSNTFISGTWAGDMMLNSSVELKSLDELYALSLHEAGHILGLEHGTDPNSPMFDHAGTIKLPPTAHDIELLRSLYGQGGSSAVSIEHDDTANGEIQGAEEIAAVQPNGMFPSFQVSGSIRNSSDIDSFVFRPRNVTSEETLVTTVVLRTATAHLTPKLSLLDSSGKAVEFSVIANGNGLIVLQSTEVEADQNYIIQVQSAEVGAKWSVGNYELAVTFSEKAQTIDKLARGLLDDQNPRKRYDLYSAKSQLVNFILDTQGSARSSKPAVVVISVFNGRGQLVVRTLARPGDVATGNTVMLGIGKYTVSVEVLSAITNSIPEVEFSINAAILSADAGPLPNNPVGNPAIGPGGTLPYVFPQNVLLNRPIVLKPPVTIKPPFFAGNGTKSNVPYQIPKLTWPNLLHNYPWLSGN